MWTVTVDSFALWREKARALLRAGASPDQVHWSQEKGGLFGESPLPAGSNLAPRVPKAFLPLAEAAACYRGPERWTILYRVLWRLSQAEPHLLEIASDPDVLRLRGMVREVERDVHKMHAFVRFRKVRDAQGQEIFVAWHEPAHLVVERATPFFARRFASMRWSILTPDRCAYWDGQRLEFGPGLTRAQAPDRDETEELWKTYYRNIFNPARIKLGAMTAEMPKRYWRTMPETALIPEMLAQSDTRVEQMLELSRQASEPAQTAERLVQASGTLDDLRELATRCQACELYRNATATVFGEGSPRARLMLVGEQPGDQEDRAGRPFIGPAGQLLRQTLEKAGASLDDVYLTNTVKHFRWIPSPGGGKRRLHKRATVRQISTCQGWLMGEIRLVEPKVLVCLGATAAQTLLGAEFRLGRDRGRWLESAHAERVLATVHPSFLLRIGDPEEKERQTARFLEDLRLAVAGLA